MTDISWPAVFVKMGINLLIAGLLRYLVIPVLAVLIYLMICVAMIPGFIAFTLWNLSDHACDWVADKGFARPNVFPNLPW